VTPLAAEENAAAIGCRLEDAVAVTDEVSERLRLDHGAVPFVSGGTGPAVVLSHAFGPRGWGWPLERLSRTCTVVAMSRFEPSSPTAPYPTSTDVILAVTRHLGIDRFTLCAWSMAGPPAITYAAGRPEQLAKLILVDVAGLGGPLRERVPRPEGEPQRRSPEEWAKVRAASWVHEPGPVRDLVEALDLEGLSAPTGFQRTMQANRRLAQAPPPLALEDVTVPTLVLAGRHSLVLGSDAAHRAAERLPDAQVVIFERSAHALALEEPERFQDVVADFVSG
jgi:pimeloyl-ACP methyl ester carboxylesterase